jgi:ERCC4-type nuclease
VILVDDRIGSAELARPLKQMGVPVKVQRLDFADCAFTGYGRAGESRIGIERKKVHELIGAMTDTRFIGHQLPGLLRAYEHRFLVVEGSYWPDASGVLMVNGKEGGFGRRRFMYRDFEHFLMSVQIKGSLTVKHTKNERDTVWWVHTCYTWFQKPWEKHTSVYAIDEVKPDFAILDERTLLRRLAAQLPGVGWVRSKAVEDRFSSVHEMFNARVADWCEVKGIGKGIARNVVRACRAHR